MNRNIRVPARGARAVAAILSAFTWLTAAFTLDQQGEPMAPFYQCFAVSRTGDPLAGGWYFYSLQTTDYFPDYPKLGSGRTVCT